MSTTSIPADYLERVYAGVLGKLIGVYAGRPFEGWTHQRILKELGPIRYYVNERFGDPLVVTDDDVSGTFVFPRALLEHGVKADLSAREIGQTWLNNVIEHRTIFWWGGHGVSTEHTAFLNLKNGIPAPLSGSIQTNGLAVAEQIGAQIFIDGWAMLTPGNPKLAAELAQAAGSVSHDGESVYAAQVLAAMEAEAFISNDIDHLIDTGLSLIPPTSLVTKLITDIRGWVKIDNDWEKTRQRIEDTYGYDKFPGFCHVIPNHGIMIMTLLYASDDFHKTMYIINTCGWDTDCNAGNVGCLVAIMNGLKCFDGGPDWRGPIADRAIISSSDGGYSINNASRITHDIVNLGRELAGQSHLSAPKDGAQFYFTLPGSVQGFEAHASDPSLMVKVEQALDDLQRSGLAINLQGLSGVESSVEVLTPTFAPPEIKHMKHYELMASPLVYPGQEVTALVRSDTSNQGSVTVALRIKTYGENDDLKTYDGPSTVIAIGREEALRWVIPDTIDSQPIQAIGLVITGSSENFGGVIWLDRLGWTGEPKLTLKRPEKGPGSFWKQAWVNSVSRFSEDPEQIFHIEQSGGEGIIIYGTREWTNYWVTARAFRVHAGSPAGIAVRVQGLNRYYALLFEDDGRVSLVKALDAERIELSSAPFDWKVDVSYEIGVEVIGSHIRGFVNGTQMLQSYDEQYSNGGIGLIATDGAVSVEEFHLAPSKT